MTVAAESHRSWYIRDLKERTRKNPDRHTVKTTEDVVAYLEALGSAAEPFERALLAELTGEPAPERPGRLGARHVAGYARAEA